MAKRKASKKKSASKSRKVATWDAKACRWRNGPGGKFRKAPANAPNKRCSKSKNRSKSKSKSR